MPADDAAYAIAALRMELDAEKFNHLRDNEHLLLARDALQAENAQLEAALAEARAETQRLKTDVSNDAVFWKLVAEGVNHHPQCMHHFAGDQRWGECMRCQNEQLRKLADAARAGIPRYLQNGGCSNCGGLPHTSTCLVGQLAAALETPDALPVVLTGAGPAGSVVPACHPDCEACSGEVCMAHDDSCDCDTAQRHVDKEGRVYYGATSGMRIARPAGSETP